VPKLNVFQHRNFSLKFFSNSFRINFPRFLIILLTLFTFVLISLPLTNTLGYEFSAINGIFLFYIGGLISIYYQKRLSERNFVSFIIDHYRIILASILIPFIVGFISSRFNSHCPVKEGIFFFIVITIPAIFFGIILGRFCSIIFKKVPALFFTFIFVVLLILPLLEFIFNPQIYFYNPVFGFLPGTIYDEDLSVDRILVGYRIFNIALFVLINYLSAVVNGKKLFVKSACVIVILLASVLFSCLKPVLHFSTDKARLKKNLPVAITTDHVNILTPVLKDLDLNYVALVHEYSLEQIENQLNAKFPNKIDSFIYESRDQKRILFGAGNADVAKPWSNQVYLNLDDFERTVKHEMAHNVGGMFTNTYFNVPSNFSPALIEGFATAIDNNYDDYPVHYMAKIARLAGYNFPIANLFSGMNFFTKASAVAYIFAGSFIKYLEDTYGAEKLKLVYKDGAFSKVYGLELDDLVKKYDEFLDNYPVNFNKSKAQLYFGGTTIFKKYCPRMAAAEVKRAWEKYYSNNIDAAFEAFERVFSYSGSYPSLYGMFNCLSKKKEFEKGIKLILDQINNFKKSPNYFTIELWYGDFLVLNNKVNEARALYDSVIAQNAHIDLMTEAKLRKLFLNNNADSLKKYLQASRKDRVQMLLELNKTNIEYCTLPVLLRLTDRNNKELPVLFERLQKYLVVNDYLSAYSCLIISKYYLQKLDYEKAKYFAVQSLAYQTDENEKYRFKENLRMVNWFSNFAGTCNIRIENNK
jgi:hypothetical protein